MAICLGILCYILGTFKEILDSTAHVVDFDERSGRHTLLYENGNGGVPLVRRLLSSRHYTIDRPRCAHSPQSAAAERDMRAAKEKEVRRTMIAGIWVAFFQECQQ